MYSKIVYFSQSHVSKTFTQLGFACLLKSHGRRRIEKGVAKKVVGYAWDNTNTRNGGREKSRRTKGFQ